MVGNGDESACLLSFLLHPNIIQFKHMILPCLQCFFYRSHIPFLISPTLGSEPLLSLDRGWFLLCLLHSRSKRRLIYPSPYFPFPSAQTCRTGNLFSSSLLSPRTVPVCAVLLILGIPLHSKPSQWK